MELSFELLHKDIQIINIDILLKYWGWKIGDVKAIAHLTALGDLFFIGRDDGIYWLQTDCGNFSKVAESLERFEECLTDQGKIAEWFLPWLVQKLILAGRTLEPTEVYSYRKPPIIGGEYTIDNIEITDINAHLECSGQIFQGIENLPDGTKISIHRN
ncbi:T6SS immunity protein Tdi1 domain-containing protein [Flavitalea antarctica]